MVDLAVIILTLKCDKPLTINSKSDQLSLKVMTANVNSKILRRSMILRVVKCRLRKNLNMTKKRRVRRVTS